MSATRIFIIGVGGQGTVLATTLIGLAAMSAGINVNASEVHGMARRGGVVESGVTLGQVMSPLISDGEADILLGFEPAETLRAAAKCSPETIVVTNSHPLPPFTVAIGQATYPDVGQALDTLGQRVKKMAAINANQLAHQAGTILSLNMVMLGAMAKYAPLPITPDQLRQAIKDNTKAQFLDMNLKAFNLGYNA